MRATVDIELVELSAGELRASIAPGVGGSIAGFCRSWSHDGILRQTPWLRAASDKAIEQRNPLGMASFPLVPFCNRIRNGLASFEGREIRFPANHPTLKSPHPLHGIGWQRPWTVASSSDTRAELVLEVPASDAWPWAFTARQQFTLSNRELSVAMSLTNEDTVAMPAGIGHHPYFPHTPGTRLTARTEAMWIGDSEVMPTTLETTDAVKKLRRGVVLSELDLDNNFTGWEREARVGWPLDATGPERSLLMRAQEPLDYFVVYCPRGYDHFCAEPVSQCTDWLNLLATHGPGPLGGTRLEPGETLHVRFEMTPTWKS